MQPQTAARLMRRLYKDLDEDPRGRPFAGIVDEIADHLLQILPLAAEFCRRIGLGLDDDATATVDLLHGPPQRLDRGRDLRHGPDDRDPGGDAGALQMM